MATKSPAAPAETPVATPLVEIAKRPDSITLFGHAHEVLEEMVLHARNGYHLYPGVTPQIFQHNGMMSVLLQLGNPLPLTSQRAAESIASEQRKEAIEFDRRVAAEAQRIATAKAQAELDARIAAVEAQAEAEVIRVRAQVAAELARIEAAAQ